MKENEKPIVKFYPKGHRRIDRHKELKNHMNPLSLAVRDER